MIFKPVLLLPTFLLLGCASKYKQSEPLAREPAQQTGKTLTLKCRANSYTIDVYQISEDGSILYDVETSGLPMGGPSDMGARWLSQNTLVITGRRSEDYACSPEQICEYRYFTIFFNQLSGSAHEIKTKYQTPDSIWNSEGKAIECFMPN